MIDNIKRFVNEHQTLMVVIIGVLIICFLYWWFCCKDKTVKRGGDVYKLPLEVVEEDGGGVYNFIGADVISEKYPLYVMNENANSLMDDKLLKYWRYFYDSYLLLDEEEIMGVELGNMFKRPVFKITGKEKDKRTTLTALQESAENFFGKVYLKNNHKFLDTPRKEMKFKFEDFVDKRTHGDVLKNYERLVLFIEKYLKGYFEKVSFVGQPASKNYDFDNLDLGRNTSLKQDKADSIDGLRLYTQIKSKLRDWYGDADIKIKLDHLYKIERGEIKRAGVKEEKKERDYQLSKKERRGKSAVKSNKKKNKTKWQVADIYPAFKLVKTVFFLLAFSSRLQTDEKDYDFHKMIASYIVYVQLFNSFCGVKMIEDWNRDISNIYVYKYKDEKKNGQDIVNMEPDYKDIARKIGESLVKHAVPKGYQEEMITGAEGALGKIEKISFSFEGRRKEDLGDSEKVKSYSFGQRLLQYCGNFSMFIPIVGKNIKLADELGSYYRGLLKNTENDGKSEGGSEGDDEGDQIGLKIKFIEKLSMDLEKKIQKMSKMFEICFASYYLLANPNSNDSQLLSDHDDGDNDTMGDNPYITGINRELENIKEMKDKVANICTDIKRELEESITQPADSQSKGFEVPQELSVIEEIEWEEVLEEKEGEEEEEEEEGGEDGGEGEVKEEKRFGESWAKVGKGNVDLLKVLDEEDPLDKFPK